MRQGLARVVARGWLRGVRPRPRGYRLAAAVGLLALALMACLSPSTSGAAVPSPVTAIPFTTVAPAGTNAPTTVASTLNLGISSVPGTICIQMETNCSAGAGIARVQMTAIAYGSPVATWPNVQVAFVLETTAYDGVYYHGFFTGGLDACAKSGTGENPLCEESNGDPFFFAHAGQVASAIQAANPRANVSFALVDYFATGQGDWSDGTTDGSQYHVDVGHFESAASFGPDVTSTLVDGVFGGQMYGDIGLDDNFLHSPSIIALYGAIIGSGLDWSPNAHHVIVLITSTSPQDPLYAENYRVSPSFYQPNPQFERHPYGSTCSPSFPFAEGASPACEGWVRPQDGNSHDSIAALARESPSCVRSVGAVCTIDVLDLWDTPTDPYSAGWPTGIAGGGPGGPIVLTDASHILEAGCDLAAATGGSWDGPSFWTCSSGETGDLTYVAHGPVFTPNTQNPSLMRAFSRIAFGPVYTTVTANHTNESMFQFVPFGSITLAPNPQWSAACYQANGYYLSTCQTAPTLRTVGGVTTYGWNWSTNATANVMNLGDQWTLVFDVMATGPPYAIVPIDACATYECRAKGSVPVGGFYTWARFVAAGEANATTLSFPLASVAVAPPLPLPHAVGSPPPSPPPPPIPPAPIAANSPVLAGPPPSIATSSLGSLSIQATAAGLLGAGFTRVTLKNRPIAQGVASLSGGLPPRIAPLTRVARAGDRPKRVGRFV